MWKWIVGIAAAIVAAFTALLIALRIKRETRTLADDAVELAERERMRTQEDARERIAKAYAQYVADFNQRQQDLIDASDSVDLHTALEALRGAGDKPPSPDSGDN